MLRAASVRHRPLDPPPYSCTTSKNLDLVLIRYKYMYYYVPEYLVIFVKRRLSYPEWIRDPSACVHSLHESTLTAEPCAVL